MGLLSTADARWKVFFVLYNTITILLVMQTLGVRIQSGTYLFGHLFFFFRQLKEQKTERK